MRRLALPGRQPVFSWTVIATTGERFSDFAPYVAAVNDVGMVAFQAALRDGGSGVFTGSGEVAAQLVGADVIAAVTSHPDVNLAGETSFYGDLSGGGQASSCSATGECRRSRIRVVGCRRSGRWAPR